MRIGAFRAKLLWVIVPVVISGLSICIHLLDRSGLEINGRIWSFWSGLVDSSVSGKLLVVREALGFSRRKEHSYKRFPILRPRVNLRDNNKAGIWNDFGVVLQSKWPPVPLEASLVEFLSEFYQGTGRTFEELVRDLLSINSSGNGQGSIVTSKIASDLVRDNLGVKLMETIVINRYYSPRVESMRVLERSQRRAFGIICKKASWIIVVYQGRTVDTFCDSTDLYASIIKGRSDGHSSISKYDLSFSKEDLGKEHVIENRSMNNMGGDLDMEIYVYIDFSDPSSGRFLKNIWNVWDVLKEQGTARIKIRHCDQVDLTEGYEYLTGFGVSVNRLALESSSSVKNSSSSAENGFQTQYSVLQNNNELDKSHKDEEYEGLSAMCDKAINMENVLDSDAKLSIECMKDIGPYLVSLSKRFEDPLGAMMHYLENFGSYQLALCNGVRTNTTLSGYSRLHERVSEGSTFFTLNGRLFSPSETNFFNLVSILKDLVFSRILLVRNGVDEEALVADALSITGMNEKEELNLFMEGLRDGSNDSMASGVYDNVIKDESLRKLIKRGEILDSDLVAEFEKDLERDPTLMDDLDWVGKREYVLSSSSPWVRSSPRTDWKVANALPLKTRHFYKDITNIGDSQWGETPGIFEDVWFNRNITEDGSDTTLSGLEGDEPGLANEMHQLEYSPWMMYRVYFSSQVQNSRVVLDYTIYDIMKEPESTLGQYLYPLDKLPELFDKYPNNVGIYPVKATILDVLVLCDPLDIECITVIIEMINKKWPIKLNLMLIDPEWVNSRKPDYSMPFSYRNLTSDEDFENRFRDIYVRSRENERLQEGDSLRVCEKYYGKANLENCPEWIRNGTESGVGGETAGRYEVYDEGSSGEHALKLAISEVFGFLVSSSTTQGMFLARAFLEMIAKNLPLLLEEDYTLSQFQDFLSKFFTHFSIKAELTRVWGLIYSNNPNENSYVNKVASYCRLKGFTAPGALINGYFVEITDLMLEEVIYGIVKKEQRVILEGVRTGQIVTSDDIHGYIFNNTVTGISSVPVVFPPFTKSIKFENWPFIGVQTGWKHIEKEVGLKLHRKYHVASEEETGRVSKGRSSSSPYGGGEGTEDPILLPEEESERALLDMHDLESLDYSILWDSNPELKHSMEGVESKSQSAPWMTFIAVVRSSRTGLLGLSTLIDYWISTLSYQASMHLNQYNELLFNRRFKVMFIGTTANSDLSLILEKCFDDLLHFHKSEDRRVPILNSLRFAKWFIRVILDNVHALGETEGPTSKRDLEGVWGERVIEIYESLSMSFFGRSGNGRLEEGYLEDLSIVSSRQRVKEKLLRKFSSKKESDVISFPCSSLGNGKLRGFPKHASYNLDLDRSDERYGKGSFRDSSLSSKDCLETFTMGLVVNGVYLRICPNTYPVYLRSDSRVDYWSSPIHSVHLKLLETAITSRMRQLVLIGEFKRSNKKEDLAYRRSWSRLGPSKVFMLVSEHLHVSNMFRSEPLIQLDDIFSSTSSLAKLHLPTVRRGKESRPQYDALIGVVAVLNPMTAYSSHILRLFDILHQLLEADIKLIYNPVLDYQSMRQLALTNTWRRYVFNYPKLNEESGRPGSPGMVSLKELLHSKGGASEFKVGRDHLYYFNSQLIAKFDIQTEQRLQVHVERSNDWSVGFLKTLLHRPRVHRGQHQDVLPGSLFRAGGELLVYELKGKEFEATMIDLLADSEASLKERVREIQLTPLTGSGFDFRDMVASPLQRIYSISEFNSFFGYLGIGWNDLTLRITDHKDRVLSLPLRILNQRLFEANSLVIHLSSLLGGGSVEGTYSESKSSSKGLLRTLHVLCLSTQLSAGEFNEDVVDQLIQLIDRGFSEKGRYNKFVIYIDSRDISQTMRDYFSYRLFWKYYINIEYLEITRPKWIPRLSVYSRNSITDILLTLDHWVPPVVERLLVLDPFSLDIVSEINDYFELLGVQEGAIGDGLVQVGDSAMVFPRKDNGESGLNPRMGLILVERYKRIGSQLRLAYFELYRDLERGGMTGQELSQNILESFAGYLSNKTISGVMSDLGIEDNEGQNQGLESNSTNG